MGQWLQIAPEGNRAYLAVPENGSGPGVLALHAWWGLTSVFMDVCDRLAVEGFVALAPSLYPDGATTDSIAEAKKLVAVHDGKPEVAEEIVLAATDQLRHLPSTAGARIGVVGFSMGAYWAFHVSQARPDDVAAVVAMYGSNDGDFTTARSAYLVHFAENDEYEPQEYVELLKINLRAAGREATFYVYPGTRHWFLEPNRPDVYDAAAAELVWKRTLDFLKAQLG